MGRPRPQRCARCAEPAARYCEKCHCAYYCSRQCQVDDWKVGTHKIVCAGPAQKNRTPSSVLSAVANEWALRDNFARAIELWLCAIANFDEDTDGDFGTFVLWHALVANALSLHARFSEALGHLNVVLVHWRSCSPEGAHRALQQLVSVLFNQHEVDIVALRRAVGVLRINVTERMPDDTCALAEMYTAEVALLRTEKHTNAKPQVDVAFSNLLECVKSAVGANDADTTVIVMRSINWVLHWLIVDARYTTALDCALRVRQTLGAFLVQYPLHERLRGTVGVLLMHQAVAQYRSNVDNDIETIRQTFKRASSMLRACATMRSECLVHWAEFERDVGSLTKSRAMTLTAHALLHSTMGEKEYLRMSRLNQSQTSQPHTVKNS